MLKYQEKNTNDSVEYFNAMDPYLIKLVNQLKDQFKEIENTKNHEPDSKLYNYT